MLTSTPLPGAGCDSGNLGDAAGCQQTPCDDRPAIEPLPDDDQGTGVLEAKAEASSSTTPTPPSTLREFEHALRGLGFTRKQATHIAKHGFTQATDAAETDAGDTEQLSELVALLRRNTALLET